jgi:hypothetical protein
MTSWLQTGLQLLFLILLRLFLPRNAFFFLSFFLYFLLGFCFFSASGGLLVLGPRPPAVVGKTQNRRLLQRRQHIFHLRFRQLQVGKEHVVVKSNILGQARGSVGRRGRGRSGCPHNLGHHLLFFKDQKKKKIKNERKKELGVSRKMRAWYEDSFFVQRNERGPFRPAGTWCEHP